jgi:hypothetical protein
MSISESKPALGAVALQFRSAGRSSDGGERYTASEKQSGRSYAVSKAGGQDPASETWLVLGGKSGELGKTANKAAAFMVAENDARVAVQQMVRAMRMAEAAKEEQALAEERQAEIEAARAEAEAEARRKAEEAAKRIEEETPTVGEDPVIQEPPAEEAPPVGGEPPAGETPQDPPPAEEEQPATGGDTGSGSGSGSGGSGSGSGGIIDIIV